MLLWIIALLLSWPSFSVNASQISTKPTRASDLPEGKARHSFSATRKTKTRPTASTYKVEIDKSDFEMRIYDQDGWLATYPVVFGTKDLKWVVEYIENQKEHHKRGTIHDRLEKYSAEDDG